MIPLTGSDPVLFVGGIVGVALFGILAGLVYLGIDRKLAAHMQARVGPPLRQPFRDVRKLLCKDSVVPEHAVPWLFNAAPILALASSITILLYLPFGGIMPLFGGWGDLVLVMYLLTIPALAMVAGGFASGSPYATVGSQREMVTMMAYEFPLAIAIIAVAWRLSMAGVTQPFSMVTIAENPVWGVVGLPGILGCLILLGVLAWVTPAELSRVPCDTPEAETELCGGLLVEYSGRNLALFQIALGVKTVAMASLAVALFLPWNLSWFIPMSSGAALGADFLFFLGKVLLVLFFSVSVIRVGMARFRITSVVSIYWGLLSGLGIVGLILVVADAMLGMGVVA
ncbi:MAG: complex I subunit 1 family protein [Methanomicrobiaceae archaeon]|nr:complex I subunit 1 family protein [Methanomicrobiaceae archaeon]